MIRLWEPQPGEEMKLRELFQEVGGFTGVELRYVFPVPERLADFFQSQDSNDSDVVSELGKHACYWRVRTEQGEFGFARTQHYSFLDLYGTGISVRELTGALENALDSRTFVGLNPMLEASLRRFKDLMAARRSVK